MLNQGEVVIGDFGFAKIGESTGVTKLGTPYYMAPEILNVMNNQEYNNKCDVFSLGVCFFAMIFGELPFKQAKSKEELLNLEMQFSGSRLKFPRSCSFQVGNLLKMMIERDTSRRISFEQLFEHPLISLSSKHPPSLNPQPSFKESPKKVSTPEPKNRNVVDEFNQSHYEGNGLNSNQKLSNVNSFLVPYLYQKNIIIFIMDSIKKIYACEQV